MGHRWKRLKRVTVTNFGDTYDTPPEIKVDPPAAPKQEAQGTATLSGTSVDTVNLDSGGNFYATPPAVTISAPDSGGTQATGIANISDGEVSEVIITDPGTGYSSPPTVTIAKSTDDKNNFAAVISLGFDSATGTVTSISVVDSGNFYDSENPPNVTIDPPFKDATFEIGEDVTVAADANGATVTGEVAQWIDSSQTLTIIHTANDDGTFIEPGVGLSVIGTNSGAERRITKVTRPNIPGDVSDEFNDEAEDFLDFSESNPFGEPEVATIVQQAAAAVAAAAVPTDKMTIRGTNSDPSYVFPKTYKIIANGVSYEFVADENEKNYIEGVRDLSIPGFAISSHLSDSGATSIQVTYTPQTAGDDLTLAGDGFIHLGIAEGNYELNTSSETEPVSSPLQAGDSAAIREGDSADAGFMTDTAFSNQVAKSGTSMVWDSAPINFGTSIGSVNYIRNFPLTLTDVPGLADPSGIVFGENGRRVYYTNLSFADSSAIVYGAKLESPYDISSISDGDEERADLSTIFSRTFYNTSDSTDFRGGQRLSALAFNPQGTKMYTIEADQDVLGQFDLSDSWDISTATFSKAITSTSISGFTHNTDYDITFNGNMNLNNTYSMEWYDSGRKMAVGKLGVNGPVDELTFTTPYDISTFSTRSGHTNNIVDSSGKINMFEYKLAFTAGSMFNYDGSRRYFLHNQFSDSDYDSSPSGYGNGLNGWRKTLLRTDLSTPYDLSTMGYHSQIELTNRADSGAPTKMGVRGAFGMHADGSKIYVLTNTMEDIPVDSGWSGTSQFNIVEFGTTGDSAGSSYITYPDISVKPMVQADSADAWAEAYMSNDNLSAWKQIIQSDPNSPHYVPPPPPVSSSVAYSVSLLDSEEDYEQIKTLGYESQMPITRNVTFSGDGNYMYSSGYSPVSGNEVLIQYGPLNSPYDITTSMSSTIAITWKVNGSGWDHMSNPGYIEPYLDTVSSYQNYSGGHGFYSPYKTNPVSMAFTDAMQSIPRYHNQTTPGAFSTQSTNNSQTIQYHYDDLDLVLDSDVDARDIHSNIKWLGTGGAYFALFSKAFGSSKGAQLAVWSQPGDKYSADGYYSYGETQMSNKYVAPGWAANYVGGKDLKGIINSYHGINESAFEDFEMNDYGTKIWLLSSGTGWCYELDLTTPYNPKSATYTGARFEVSMINTPTSLHWVEARQSLFIGGDGLKSGGSYTTGNAVIEYKIANENYIPLEFTPGTLANKVVSANIGERPTTFALHDDIPDFASTVQRMFFVDDGKKMIMSNPASQGDGDVAFYNLADSYDVRTSTLDSSKSLKTQAESTAAFTVGGTSYFNGRTNADLMFNDSGTEVTIHQGVSQNSNVSTQGNLYWRTFYLDSAFNLNTINNTPPLISTLHLNTFSAWHRNEYSSALYMAGANHSKWADNGNKLVWYDINTNHMFAYNVPTPYNHQSINFYDDMINVGDTADLFSFRDFDSGSWKDYMVSLNPSSGAYINFDDFHFNDSGTRMWSTNEGLEGHELWQFDLNTPWDLQSIDSASWELILYPSHGDGGGYGPDYGLDAITVTPTGLLYATSPRYVDSSGSQAMGNHILGWDLTKDSNNRPYVFPADSDNSYFRSSATHLISTVENGLLYSNDPRTAGTGNVFALAINEGILADNSDSSYTTDSAYTVSIALDDLYGGGYGNAFQLAVVEDVWGGVRGFTMGGNTNGNTATLTNAIHYFDTTTPGNAIDFGDLTEGTQNAAAGGNGTRILRMGGSKPSPRTKTIDYFTCATPGNAIDFGDLTGDQYGTHYAGVVSNGTLAIHPGGSKTAFNNIIEYVTINTPGNSIDFGDLTKTLTFHVTTNDTTRGITLGGYSNESGSNQMVTSMDYFTMATPSNASDFGDLLTAKNHSARGTVSNDTRGLCMGGQISAGSAMQDVIEYITIQTLGNGTDFGDLTAARAYMAACSNETGDKGFVLGGATGSGNYTNAIDVVTISTAGNAVDFGDGLNNMGANFGASGNAA